MKKIGIITYHFARNYGAVWQCYALQEYLNKNGYSVSILNAVSEKQEKNNSLFHKKNGVRNLIVNIMLFPFILQRKEKEQKFAEFVDAYLKCSKKVTDADELKILIDSENYDVVISGSDQVFNPDIADFEDMFLFPFDTKAKKVGYSVSIGGAAYDELKRYSHYIKEFYRIGVRESGAKPVVERLYGKKTDSTVDPVLLLTKAEWEKFVSKKEDSEKYLLCYFVDRNPMLENMKIAETIAKKRGLKIKCIWMHFAQKSFDNRFINNAGPIDFLNYISNADAIITDGYHGTVFSTIFEKEIFAIIKSSESTDTRIKDYFTLIGLENRLLCGEKDEIDYQELDYSIISPKIAAITKSSYLFLHQVIDS